MLIAKLRVVCIGLMTAWLVSPVSAQQAPAAAPGQVAALDMSVTGQALRRVRTLLMDPASAEFREVVAYRSGVVCGQVNSRRPDGSFTGYTRFAVRSRRVSVFSWPAPGEFDFSQVTLEELCR